MNHINFFPSASASTSSARALDAEELQTSTVSSVEKVFNLYKAVDPKNSVSLSNRFLAALGKPDGLKNLTITIADPKHPEKCIQMRLPIYSITNEPTQNQTIFDGFLNSPFQKEFLQDRSIKFDLSASLPNELTQKILEIPEILDAYRNYKIGQPISLSLNERGVVALIEFSDFIGDSNFALSIPAVVVFLLQVDGKDHFSEKLFDHLVLGDGAMDSSLPEYPIFENYVINFHAWKKVVMNEKLEALEKAAKEGHPPALIAWLDYLTVNDEPVSGFKEVLRRVSGNHIVLQALMNFYDITDQQAFSEAIKKDENGRKKICSPFAEYMLSLKINNPEALQYLTESAMGGNVWAMRELCKDYLEEWKTKKNPEDAAKLFGWATLLANTGDPKAMCSLGFNYSMGIGTEPNQEAAFDCFTKSAEAGNPAGMFNLGVCYTKGTGTVKNLKAGFEWHFKSANKGDSSAMFNLGFCYEKGMGIDPNLEEALKWYRESTNRGFSNNGVHRAIERVLSLQAASSHKRKAEQPADTDSAESNTEQKTSS